MGLVAQAVAEAAAGGPVKDQKDLKDVRDPRDLNVPYVVYVLSVLLVLSGCRPEPASPPLPWSRIDLSREAYTLETGEPVTPKLSFLGSAEVRDMRLVPRSQLAAFPTRTAGQVQCGQLARSVRSAATRANGWSIIT